MLRALCPLDDGRAAILARRESLSASFPIVAPGFRFEARAEATKKHNGRPIRCPPSEDHALSHDEVRTCIR
jgi:hypothetical protein